MKITHHTDLLNALIEKYNLKSYLEIGVQNPSNNFSLINIPGKKKYPYKVGVDPDKNIREISNGFLHNITSDEFFSFNQETFDLIFIDGLHHADQAKRDFENSLKCLNDNGFILIHDCLPENEQGTKIPRETRVWWGDVYKFCMSIRNHYSDIAFKTFNVDNGCMLVWKEPNFSYTTWNEAPFDWDTYTKFGHRLMNVVNEVTI